MTDTLCGFPGDRDEALVACLYDDRNAIERATFDAHLATCLRCREELAALRGVRLQLAKWAPPEPAHVLASSQPSAHRLQPAPSPQPPAPREWWREMPAWAQVAAALLFLGASAGLANLDVRYDSNGLNVRTGWMRSAGASDVAREASFGAGAPWRTDLAALERQLRGEFRAVQTTLAAAPPALVRGTAAASDAETIRRLQALINERINDSEKRQAVRSERELALRVAQVMTDVNAQRQSDLVRIERGLGVVQANTSAEVLKQREAFNQQLRYIVSASQKH